MNQELLATTDNTVIWRTDWLGTNPLFYNEQTLRTGQRIQDVMDPCAPVELDAEGSKLFLDFGYCVFGLTPFRHVRFVPPCSELRLVNDHFETHELPDPADVLFVETTATNETEVTELIRDNVKKWEASISGQIILPLSGGFDSRFLALCVHDRSRIRAFTYGVSSNQQESREVVAASAVAHMMGIQWERIPLHNVHRHMNSWYNVFDCSTHAHGMYQMEFYEQIKKRLAPQSGLSVLSGIIGDVWAGTWDISPIANVSDLALLGKTHGMHADSANSVFDGTQEVSQEWFSLRHEKLCHPLYRIVTAVRCKMMLLRYLLKVPEIFDFKPYSPFLNPEIGLAMLRLQSDRRKDRLWQRSFFRGASLDIESLKLKGDYEISLNQLAVQEFPLCRLSESCLSKIVVANYVSWINRRACNAVYRKLCEVMLDFRNGLLRIPYLNALLFRFGFRELQSKFNMAYFAYLTLWPVQKIICQTESQTGEQ